ncbi:MAG TPA: hypothetical protein VMU10_12125 [Desulfomonilia bacterium]|nr:hypothetical protein [Desulfomonilia bacterium]
MKIHLTPKGKELAVKLLPVAQTLNRKMEELVGGKEIKKLIQILDIIEKTVWSPSPADPERAQPCQNRILAYYDISIDHFFV